VVLKQEDNTEGSLGSLYVNSKFMPITNSKQIRNLRIHLKLSDRQRKILIGSLLGDGCLILNSWGKHYRYQAEQFVGKIKKSN